MGLITPTRDVPASGRTAELAGSGGMLVKPGEEGFTQISSKLADKGFLVTTTWSASASRRALRRASPT
jgi:NADH-quinone oxidoreductase subunit B